MTATATTRSPKPRSHHLDWKVWLLYVVGFVPAAWTFWLGASGNLGADPVKTFEHTLGLWALRFLILTLMISPLRDILRLNLLRYRRALGLLTFYYACMHLLVYMTLDQGFNLVAVITDIVKRPFITIGMATLLLLLPLALTSNRWSIRKLGKNWAKLHQLVYVAAIGGSVHFLLAVKGWPAEPIAYASIITMLLLWRAIRKTTLS